MLFVPTRNNVVMRVVRKTACSLPYILFGYFSEMGIQIA